MAGKPWNERGTASIIISACKLSLIQEVARWRETAAKNDGGESSSQNTHKSRKHLCTKENVYIESQNKIVNEYM